MPSVERKTIGELDILRVIAETPKNIVYLAQDRVLDRLLAVKLSKHNLESERGEQFHEEGRRLARQFVADGNRLALAGPHPNIIEVHFCGTDEITGSPYLALQYVPGPTLEDRLKNEKFVDSVAVRVIRDVTSGLEHLHKAGVMHHDIQPKNIGFGPDGNACILDLGGSIHKDREKYDDFRAMALLANKLSNNIVGSKKRIRRISNLLEKLRSEKFEDVRNIIDSVEGEITRRKFISYSLITLGFAGTGLLVKKKVDEVRSIKYAVDKIKSIDVKNREDFRVEKGNLLNKIAEKQRLLISSGEIRRKAFPYNIPKGNNEWSTITANWEWTTGFFPGMLWALGKKTKDDLLISQAENWTNDVAESHVDDANNTNSIRCFYSYGNAYEMTKKSHFLDRVLEASRIVEKLATKGYVSFRGGGLDSNVNAISLDHMEMAIPLLNMSYRFNNRSSLKSIIEHHSSLTQNVLVDDDGSSIQCGLMDPSVPKLLNPIKIFGYSGRSCLTRSHARAILGFLDVYNTTGDKRCLGVADRLISYASKNIPNDFILPYDFKDPSDEIPKDTASTSMFALALSRRSKISDSEKYESLRDSILKSLIGRHLVVEPEYQGLLNGGCANHSKKLENMALIYGDYYFVKALCESI